MHLNYCFCTEIPSLLLNTKVSLLIHAKELKRTTNTGRLATLALVNSSLHVRGQKDETFDPKNLLDVRYTPVLFFPSDDAIDLNALSPSEFKESIPGPIQLIVPDGNWRQASKINTRYPEFAALARVKISAPNSSQFFLRKETTPEGMATLQAIAQALAVIESPEVGDRLMSLYRLKLELTMKARGVKLEI